MASETKNNDLYSVFKMNKIIRLVFFIGIILTVISCKQPYDPPAIAGAKSFLVVEGFINLDAATNIRLSRTTQLKDTAKIVPETGAILIIEDEQNSAFYLSELSGGNYLLPASGLSPGKKYRLRIKTTSSTEYLSDYIEAIQTPKIDSINFRVQNGGVQFYANTHDDQAQIKYYRWDYEETWLYKSLNESSVEFTNSVLKPREFSNSINKCWKTNISNEIILGSSANLSSDLILNKPLIFVTAASGKLSFGYSILVRQYALNKDAFEYWQTLKKNTEQLGSIFDPQPSIASGNIHSVSDPDEPVIGHLSVSTVTSKRLYFDNKDLPIYSPSNLPPPSIEACENRSILIAPASTFADRVIQTFSSGAFIPTNPISPPGQGLIGYTYAPKDCVDCRLKGGTTVKPVFWP